MKTQKTQKTQKMKFIILLLITFILNVKGQQYYDAEFNGFTLQEVTVNKLGEIKFSANKTHVYSMEFSRSLSLIRFSEATYILSQKDIDDNLSQIIENGYIYVDAYVFFTSIQRTYKGVYFYSAQEGDKGYNGWQICNNFSFLAANETHTPGGRFFENTGVKYIQGCGDHLNFKIELESEKQSGLHYYSKLRAKINFTNFPLNYKHYKRGITKMTNINPNMAEMEIQEMFSNRLVIRVPNENPNVNEYGHKRNEQYVWKENREEKKKDFHLSVEYPNIYKTGGRLNIS